MNQLKPYLLLPYVCKLLRKDITVFNCVIAYIFHICNLYL